MQEQIQEEVIADADASMAESMSIEQASLDKLSDDAISPPDEDNLNAILDIPISLSVEIGQTKINIRNLLQLNQGSVVELDRLAGEPLDVMVNNTLVAHGEIVVINEKYGIRLTDVISTLERVKNLQ
ncbi:MAG: flagellar motor switch protein FliN [Gammaproteobacteria bacterium]|nr:flagellar motor switch protein FliN [Gammaproteobacteria bacterium]